MCVGGKERDVAVEQQLEIQVEQRTTALPRLIEASTLLQLAGPEIDLLVSRELARNPALEEIDTPACPICGADLEGFTCPRCPPRAVDDPRARDAPLRELEHPLDRPRDDDTDPMAAIARGPDVRAAILADARASLDRQDHAVAEAIVASLDDRGWLALPLEDLAATVRRSVGDVERVLATVQAVAPAGVGARSLLECLQLQGRELAATGLPVPALLAQLDGDDLLDLAAHRYRQLARRHGTTAEEVEAAHGFIRTQLTPNPLQHREAVPWQQAEPHEQVIPDVIVRIVDEGLEVGLAMRSDTRLRINEEYVCLVRQLRNGADRANGAVASLSDDDRHHVRSAVRSAREFISKLEQRRRTLLRIATVVCQRQEAFVRGTVRDLRPLTRGDVAAELGLNESTVSRATAGKHVMLPSGQVVPFSAFFQASLSVKDVIREIIANESKMGRTLSDQRICDLLNDQGYRIARRTVTKYRLQLDILPSTHRHA